MTNPEEIEDPVIKLELHVPEWLLSRLAEFRNQNQSKLILKKVEKSRATLKDAFPDGKITASFESLGVGSYPHYILIDPNGKIVLNDGVCDPKAPKAVLRLSKLEVVREFLLNNGQK